MSSKALDAINSLWLWLTSAIPGHELRVVDDMDYSGS